MHTNKIWLLFLGIFFIATSMSYAQGLKDLMPERLTIGAALGAAYYAGNDTLYRQVLAREFNEVVAENELKWYQLQPLPGVWDFSKADSLVAFAGRNGMRLHGHVLVWHQGLPNWLQQGNFTRSQMLGLLKTHIDTVLKRYRGSFASFDVVNEAFDDQPNGSYRRSIWFNTIGRDYLDSAFVYAHRADPSLKLYYNDYNIEWINAKSDSVRLRLNQMRQRGVPVHGVGFQGHFILNLNNGFLNSLRQNLNRFAQAGYEIRYSEVDIRIPAPTTQAKLLTQGRDYSNLLRISLANNAVKSFTLWGFTDRYSWIPGFFSGFDDALIFDRNYQPKPAYDSLRAVLQTITHLPTGQHELSSATKKAIGLTPLQAKTWLSQQTKPWRLVNLQGKTIVSNQKTPNPIETLKPGLYWFIEEGREGGAVRLLVE